jgi:hypothetical protein
VAQLSTSMEDKDVATDTKVDITKLGAFREHPAMADVVSRREQAEGEYQRITGEVERLRGELEQREQVERRLQEVSSNFFGRRRPDAELERLRVALAEAEGTQYDTEVAMWDLREEEEAALKRLRDSEAIELRRRFDAALCDLEQALMAAQEASDRAQELWHVGERLWPMHEKPVPMVVPKMFLHHSGESQFDYWRRSAREHGFLSGRGEGK